jgi:tripartite-type tricarboxylate transporter receptor subunit TctC
MFKDVKPNGETMATLLFLSGALITGDKLPVDISKFVYVGSTGQGTIVYVRTDTGLKSADDFINPPKQIIMGNASPNSQFPLSMKLFLNALGLKGKYKALHGYRGMLGMLQSVRSGETNMSFLHAGQYFARLPGFKKEGIIFGIMELGLVGEDGKTHGTPGADLPTMEAVWERLAPNSLNAGEYKAYHNVLRVDKPLSWLHVLPPGTPDKYRKVWEDAMAAAFKDPEYLALLAKRGAPPAVFFRGEKTLQLFNQIKTNMNDPDIKAAIASILTRK